MIVARTLLVAFVLAATPALAQERQEQLGDVTIQKVTLATGGLAQVEGAMRAPGETMTLAIERSQVADVLRTLVITGDASVVSIDLPAAEPVGERSETGRLLAGDLADPVTVLRSLIGEVVEVRGGANQLSGRLLAFSTVGVPIEEREDLAPALRISVATADGRVAYATFPLLEALAIEGEAVDERMAGVVPALGESVDDGRRELTVRLAEPASVGFSFVVPTTVWRPSYRAVVAGEEVSLQGWATLENTTGFDWDAVELALSVGTPVAYRQDVYAPLRTSRPEAPFEVGRTVEAPIVAEAAAAFASVATEAMEADSMERARPAPRARALAGAEVGGPAVSGSASTVFPVSGPIDLAAGRTLTVPFLDGTERVDTIAYLDLDAPQSTPMDALELAFDEAATVPGGLIAVYDETGFVGDARFAGADGGATNILPYALSADVDATVTDRTRQLLASASLADGVLRLTRELRTRIVLMLEADEPKTLIADASRDASERTSLETSSDFVANVEELGDGRARLRAELPAGASRIIINAVRPIVERYMVSDLTTPVIEKVLSLGDALDEATRLRLEAIAAIAARIAEIDRTLATLDADVEDLRRAVAADRENLEAIDVSTPEGAEVRERIVRRTNEIDEALSRIRELRQERLDEERALRG